MWVAQYARQHNIESLEDMLSALRAGAQGTMSLDPPPLGPEYVIHPFKPTPKGVLRKLDAQACGLQIEYTYALRFERGPKALEYPICRNFVFSDLFNQKTAGETLSPIRCLETKNADEWRISYRSTEPEKNPLNVALLQRRQAKQGALMDLSKCSRRRTYLETLLRNEKHAASVKAKMMRTKRVLAVNLKEQDSDAESSDSSDSP